MELPIVEHFYTLQGEGFYAGQAAYFIRTGGCDVGCTWCDTKESWDAAQHPKFEINEIVQWVTDAGAPLAVITGGEPMMHNLSELCDALHDKNISTNLETSGAYPLSGEWDWICFSPKKFKAPLDDYYSLANELKIVVFNQHDLLWAQEHAKKITSKCILYLQPEWSKQQELLPIMIDFIKAHPQWRLSLQTHKYLNIP